MSAYLRRAVLGMIPEGLNWYLTQTYYSDPAMSPAPEKYGIDGLRIGFIDPSLISKGSPIIARGSVQFGSPCILINPEGHHPNTQGQQWVLRHEISHIKNADTDKMLTLFGAVASGTSMALRYSGILSGATGKIRKIWHSCCKEGFSIGLGSAALIGYSRRVEARADAEASSQSSQEEKQGVIQWFRSMQENHKMLRNQEQLLLDDLENQEKAKIQAIQRKADLLIQEKFEQSQDAYEKFQAQQKVFDFMCNPNSLKRRSDAEWLSWPVAQITNPHYVTSKGGNGALREVTRTEFESLLQEDVDLAKESYNMKKRSLDASITAKDTEIETVKNTMAVEKNKVQRVGRFLSPLFRVLISEEGDDRTDVFHPSVSSRILRLEETSRSISS